MKLKYLKDYFFLAPHTSSTSWWFFTNPFEKYAQPSNWIPFHPRDRGELPPPETPPEIVTGEIQTGVHNWNQLLPFVTKIDHPSMEVTSRFQPWKGHEKKHPLKGHEWKNLEVGRIFIPPFCWSKWRSSVENALLHECATSTPKCR